MKDIVNFRTPTNPASNWGVISEISEIKHSIYVDNSMKYEIVNKESKGLINYNLYILFTKERSYKMGKSLNIFKSYTISMCDFGYKEIEYIDNNDRDFTYTSIKRISKYFEKQGLEIPIYNWLEPPIDETLELIEPKKVSNTISIILNDCTEEMKETFLELKKYSDKGYYFVWDNE